MAETNGNGTKLNTGPLLVILTVLIGISSVGAGGHFAFIRPLERQLETLRLTAEVNTQRIDRLVEGETQRNNRIEARLAAEEAVTKLFTDGKFILTGGK